MVGFAGAWTPEIAAPAAGAPDRPNTDCAETDESVPKTLSKPATMIRPAGGGRRKRLNLTSSVQKDPLRRGY